VVNIQVQPVAQLDLLDYRDSPVMMALLDPLDYRDSPDMAQLDPLDYRDPPVFKGFRE